MTVGSSDIASSSGRRTTPQVLLGLHSNGPTREPEVGQVSTPIIGDPPDARTDRHIWPSMGSNVRQTHEAIIQHALVERSGGRGANESMDGHN